MLNIKPITLTTDHIQLEILNQSHFNELNIVSQDERIWKYTTANVMGDGFARWFNKAIQDFQAGNCLPFVVRRLSDKKLLGSTRYYHIDRRHHRLCIGYTWLIPEVWETYVNSECKYLLLKHAFEDLNVNRVEFMADARNLRSRAAIKKLGAREEGILRQHMILENGYVRDSIVFSIIKSEWPEIKMAFLKKFK
ncbi:MAG: hypothetical protein A3F12_04615 [Gammaproteobacteria bacterium RIFCSPHIGHO2_12_FULL_38_14]|nr:MAG: hypothetical protein A3F12_04615 [Gammaproteobacteria bacterium RIFCSPHIGHO2_12_FULL_38_14]